MAIRIHKITAQDLAENMKEFVDYFLERGSAATLAAIDNYYQVSTQLQIVVANADEINWAKIGVRDVEMFLSGARTIISDIEYEGSRVYEKFPIRVIDTPKPRQTTSGYVYLIRAIFPDNYYKIGLSKSPIERVTSLGVLLPFPIEVLHLIPTNDMYGLEKSLHKRFASKRVNGEWFTLDDIDVHAICAMKGNE